MDRLEGLKSTRYATASNQVACSSQSSHGALERVPRCSLQRYSLATLVPALMLRVRQQMPRTRQDMIDIEIELTVCVCVCVCHFRRSLKLVHMSLIALTLWD